MAELADATDSKSVSFTGVWVRFPPPPFAVCESTLVDPVEREPSLDANRLLRLAAHEWRNLALLAQGHTSLADRRADDPERVRKHLADARRALELATRLADDCSAFAADENGANRDGANGADDSAHVEIDAVLTNIASLAAGFARDGANASELEIAVVNHGEPGARLQGSSALFTRALLNLVLNAYEAGNDTTKHVTVTWSTDGDRGRCVIDDDGPGMPPELRRALQDGSSSPRAEAGRTRGLGFAVVHEAVAVARGSLRVDSREPNGTRVTIDVPLIL